MFFWAITALLTFLATLCVVLPLARRAKSMPARIDYDKALYKARLAEIEKERQLGRISDSAADAAVAEEGRKLILLAEAGAPTGARPERLAAYRAAIALTVIAVPALALGLYFALGNPSMPDQSLAARKAADPASQPVEELIARAEAHLAEKPDDVRGWRVLAPVYARFGRFDDAVFAWENVRRLAPGTAGINATIGETIMAANDGLITDEAKRFFAADLEADPQSAKAKFYLAMALGQEGRHEEAAAAWRELIAAAPADAPWLSAAKDFRNRSLAALGESEQLESEDAVPAIGVADPPGPSREQIAAASELSADDRNAMIRGMVENLAGKLAEDPADKQGWQRLVRSYVILNEPQKAREAIKTAMLHHGDDSEFARAMQRFQRAIEQ